jgi:hypothetical protein
LEANRHHKGMTRSRSLLWLALPWLTLALWLVAMALLQPVNHDEDQYVGAAVLAGNGLKAFRAFLYLQPPVQLWLTGPIAAATPGWSFAALRLTSAALGLATLALVHAALRRSNVPRRVALWMCVLVAASAPFAYGARVARNDVLPTALLALAVWQLVGAPGCKRLAVAGLALGLAASTKLSFAPPLAFAGLWLAWQAIMTRTPGGWQGLLAFAIGCCAGLAPIAAAWIGDPDPFRYGVFTFAGEATFDWYRMNGDGDRLTLFRKLWDAIFYLAQGPALLALLLLTWRPPRGFGMIDALLVGSLFGALLPTPTWPQYFIGVVPPLFVRLGQDWRRLSRLAAPALGACAVVVAGVLAGIGGVGCWRAGAPAALAITRDAHWIGAQVKATGAIASLSTARIIDAGRPIDRRFATGVFVYRSADRWSAADLARWHVVSPRTLAAEFDREPPAAILTGYERRSAMNVALAPDAVLIAWAQAHAYEPLPTPDGRGTLWRRATAR